MVELTRDFIITSVKNADKRSSGIRVEKITKEIKGLNSERIRHLLNNLCSQPGTVFLELGTFRGASVISAVWGNKSKAYTIDNFTFNPLGQPSKINPDGWPEIEKSVHNLLSVFKIDDRVTVLKNEFSKVKLTDIKEPVDILFYDANTSREKVKKDLFKFLPKLKDTCIILTSQADVEDTTPAIREVIAGSKFNIDFEYHQKSRAVRDQTQWWSGVRVWLLKKEASKETKEKGDK